MVRLLLPSTHGGGDGLSVEVQSLVTYPPQL